MPYTNEAGARPAPVFTPANAENPSSNHRKPQLGIVRAVELPRFARGVESAVAAWEKERRAASLDIDGLREKYGINEVFARQLAAALLGVRP